MAYFWCKVARATGVGRDLRLPCSKGGRDGDDSKERERRGGEKLHVDPFGPMSFRKLGLAPRCDFGGTTQSRGSTGATLSGSTQPAVKALRRSGVLTHPRRDCRSRCLPRQAQLLVHV
jgi:hypothetical protein